MNKTYILLLALFFFIPNNLWAKKDPIKYPVSSISEELKKNAHVVTRFNETLFTVESISEAKLKNHQIITIMNKNGDYASKKIVSYNKLLSLKNFKIHIYDADGNLIKKVKNSDIKDYCATSGGTLFDDNRVKYYEALQNNYPFTIEYEYEREFNGILSYPEWLAIDGYNRSVEQTEFTVRIPDTLKLRNKTYHFDGNFTENTEEGIKSYKWSANNIKAFKSEPFSPDFQHIVSRVVTAPVEFEMEGFKGSQDSWINFGKWMQELGKDRIELPETTIIEISELIANCKTDKEKIEILYKYMQSKTRYVSIQLGIGGWQPFPAETVDKLGYGDCKALANYMKAILRVAGIYSNYTLVSAGSGKHYFDKDFVKNQFNHAILMVPLAQDSVWLECTSQQQACGFLGSFTNDRDVLIIKENGGQLIHTPTYTAKQNTQTRKADVIIDENGDTKAKIRTRYTGLQYENLRSIYYDGIEDQKKALYKSMTLSDFKIDKLRIEQEKKSIPESQLELELTVKNYLSKAGERLFLPLNLLNKSTYIPKKIKERKTSIVLDYPYIDSDTITYTLPNNLIIERQPQAISLDTEFGKYTSQIIVNENKVTYIRTYQRHKGEFTPDKYEALRKFFKSIARADKTKLILKLKPEGA